MQRPDRCGILFQCHYVAGHRIFKKIFFVNVFNSDFNTQAMHSNSILHDSIAMLLAKTLTPWRDSNSDLMALRRM
jgi:hypothetical protein